MLTPTRITPYRKRRNPQSRAVAKVVKVLAVARLDANKAIWALSAQLVEVNDVNGLTVDGNVPGGVQEFSPQLVVEYDEGVSIGDPWSADPGGFVGEFVNGGTLAPGAGTVVAAIAVEQVGTDDPPQPGRTSWVFSAPITLVGTPTGLRVQVGGEWIEPIGAEQSSPQEIWVTYDTSETLDGKAYSIVARPGGMAEAPRIVLPQSGTVISP